MNLASNFGGRLSLRYVLGNGLCPSLFLYLILCFLITMKWRMCSYSQEASNRGLAALKLRAQYILGFSPRSFDIAARKAASAKTDKLTGWKDGHNTKNFIILLLIHVD